MKINNSNNNKGRRLKYSLIALAVILVIGASIVYWLKVTSPPQDTTTKGPTPEQQKEMKAVDDANKKAFAESTKGVDNPGVAVPIPTTPDTIELTANKTNDTTVTVFTKLKNYASGTCELTITNGTRTHTASAQILYQPEYSTCAGFSVPVSQLGSGNWVVKLIATPTGGEPVSQAINLEVQ
jgi:hypothetical protein